MAVEIQRMSPATDIARIVRELETLQAEALYFYNQTEFSKLLKKYAFGVNGEIIEGQSALEEREDAQDIYWPRKKDSIVVSVLWQETRLTTDGFEYWHRAVGLEAHPNGAVSIYGGIVLDPHSSPGSSFLTIDEWRNNKAVQEHSLRKAFEIPLVTHYSRELLKGSTYLH